MIVAIVVMIVTAVVIISGVVLVLVLIVVLVIVVLVVIVDILVAVVNSVVVCVLFYFPISVIFTLCTSYFSSTGTPIQNNLEELFTVVDFTAPGYLGTLQEFQVNRWIDSKVYRY